MRERRTATAERESRKDTDRAHLPSPPSGASATQREIRDEKRTPAAERDCERKFADLSRAEISLADVGPSSDPAAVLSLAQELRCLHQHFSDGESRRFLERKQAERGEGGFAHYRFVAIRDFYTHVLDPSMRPERLDEELRSGGLIGGVRLSGADRLEFGRILKGLDELNRLAERMRSGTPSLEDAKKLSELLGRFHADFGNDRKARRILETFFRRRGIPNPEEYAHRQFEAIQKFYSLIEGKSDAEILSLMKTAEFRERFSAAFTAFSMLSKETKECLEVAICHLSSRTSRSSKAEHSEEVSPGLSMTVPAKSDAVVPPLPQSVPQVQISSVSSVSSAAVTAKQITQALTELAAAASRRAEKIEKESERTAAPREKKRSEIAAIVRRIAASHPEIGLELKMPDTKFMSEADVNAMLVQYRNMEASLMGGGRRNGSIRNRC